MIDLDAVDAQLAALPTSELAQTIRDMDSTALLALEAVLVGQRRAVDQSDSGGGPGFRSQRDERPTARPAPLGARTTLSELGCLRPRSAGFISLSVSEPRHPEASRRDGRCRFVSVSRTGFAHRGGLVKRVMQVGVLMIILTGTAAVAADASGLLRTYKTRITRPSYLAGTYRITFTPGHWAVHGPINSGGTDRISGHKITIHGTGPCRSPGTYRFKLGRSTVKFTKISDPCPRAALITAQTWTRA